MKLSMLLSVADDPVATTRVVQDMESAGLDLVWVPEAYAYDAFVGIAHLLNHTERISVGSGIVNVYSRSAALLAMAALTCDRIAPGRVVLGLGASGPQVVEGLHGVPYSRPMRRVEETIEICRKAWAGDKVEYDGAALRLPLMGEETTGLGKALRLIARPENQIPVWWASLKPRAVESTARVADGWLTVFFLPDRADAVWGDALRRGADSRSATLGSLDTAAGGLLAIGDDLTGSRRSGLLDSQRDLYALYIGGMGAREKNFYHDVVRAYGYEAEATAIQDAYLDGRRAEAAQLVPDELLELTNLVGPRSWIAERIEVYRAAGVTHLQIAPAPGRDVRSDIATLREVLG